MSAANEHPWGEVSFARERDWYEHLSDDPESFGVSKADYDECSQLANAHPEYDLYEHIMPTDRPKLDIGRYVMQQGISVPLINSMDEWQTALDRGTAMLRSELRQDYSGYSGLLSSVVIPRFQSYPKDEYGRPAVEPVYDSQTDQPKLEQLIEGPVQSWINLSDMNMLSHIDPRRTIGSVAVRKALHEILADGLYDGSVSPAAVMRHMAWDDEQRQHYRGALAYGYHAVGLSQADVSRWQHIPGINVCVFRDPIIDGKYFVGGRDAHHHWEITNGRDSDDMAAYTKSVYRGAPKPDEPLYKLPTQKIIDCYEQIRTLPHFDQRQAPIMEFQYGANGELYFLQYLKTGHIIRNSEAFSLPSTRTSATTDLVRGATPKDGEQLRIYLDPTHITPGMKDQAVHVGLDLGRTGHTEQAAVMQAKVAIANELNFKDNHYSSTALTRPPVALGLWDGKGELEKRLYEIKPEANWESTRKIEYINARITSNGRQASVDSDWELRSDS